MAAFKFRTVIRLWWVFAAAVTGLVLSAQALSAEVGYSISSVGSPGETQLYRVDLATGDATLVGPLGIQPYTGPSAASSPDGEIFLIDSRGLLLEIDPQTGEASMVADLPLTQVYGLAVAADGDLRVVADSLLYRVSSTSGMILDTIALAEDVRKLAGNGQQIQAIWFDDDLGELVVGEMDSNTGDLDEGTVLEDIWPCLFGADLDSRGNLWTVTNTCTLLLAAKLDRFDDLSTGIPETVAIWAPGVPQIGFTAFVIPQMPTVVDIPTLNPPGLIGLILSLALVGGWVLARRE